MASFDGSTMSMSCSHMSSLLLRSGNVPANYSLEGLLAQLTAFKLWKCCRMTRLINYYYAALWCKNVYAY